MSANFYPTLFQHLATDYQRNLAVTAGAGTGKTEVLTRRIIKILAREKHCLDRLLVLTFTDKAAVEMKERIYGAIETEFAKTNQPHFQKLKDSFLNNYISTFHAFCAALLREYPIEAGIDPYFRVLDETDKIFFLRKSINRSLKELAADKNNKDIHLLGEEFSKSTLGNSIFTIIQKREDTGRWITDFSKLDQSNYHKRLREYRDCVLREMAYKLHRSRGLESCLQKLESAGPEDPDDDSALSRKRYNLIGLIPLLLKEIAPAVSGPIDAAKVSAIKAEIVENLKLPTSIPKAWPDQVYETFKEGMLALRYLLKSFPVEEFEIVESHEQYGFELLKALARIAEYCLRVYHDDKAAANYLDFQDLQLKTLHLLEAGKHSHILDELRERFLFVMVDEFQDTNDIQWRIIKEIAADKTEKMVNPKLFIVGDEKQAIYSFRGGDVCLFSRVRRELLDQNRSGGHDLHSFDLSFDSAKNYEAEYREKVVDDSMIRAGEIIFSDNFRSAAVPINFFNMFFHDLLCREVYEEYDAKPQRLLCSGNKTQGSVELLIVDGGSEFEDESLDLNPPEGSNRENPAGGIKLKPHFKEALLIVDQIKEVFFGDDEKYLRVRDNAQKGRPAIAILLNRRTMIKTYEEALRMNRIDFTVVRGRGFFQRQEIVDLGNLFKFLVNPADDRSLVAFLRSPAGHVSDEGIFTLSKIAYGSSLWEKLTVSANDGNKITAPHFSSRDYESILNAAANLTGWLGLSGRMPLVEFLRMILDEGGYYVSFCRGIRGDQAISNIEKLLDSAREIMLKEGGDLADFAEWLNNRIDYIEEEGEADIDISLGGAVQIMTVHQSKGLEFPMVFVPDLGAGFNLGEREALYADYVPLEMKITDNGIVRKEIPEIGINAPNPEKEWESEPVLIKRIIKKRLKDKLIAEKKRLLYVAATRAMDHLVLVGHSDFSSDSVIQRIKYAPLDQLTNWMDWVNRILGISFLADSFRGEIWYGNEAGEPMRIPYRKFTAEGALIGPEAEYRTEFPVE
jgi:ATP-dependent helicase/nuclease subunit A